MAASSTSSSRGENESYVFDVFISHRGADVKKTLATDLYHRLCKHDLQVFLDEQELRAGENLTPQIESAIRTATVHIAIFSPNYASSKWCLDELVLMVDSMSNFKSTVIPVFYGVKPAELRWTQGGKGAYAQTLSQLQQKKNVDGQPRYDSNTLEKWRKALSDVAEIKDFDGETYNRSICITRAQQLYIMRYMILLWFSMVCSGGLLTGMVCSGDWRLALLRRLAPWQSLVVDKKIPPNHYSEVIFPNKYRTWYYLLG